MADRTCSVDGCEKSHEARGLCKMHYTRLKRYGDVGEATGRRYYNTATVCTLDGCDAPVARLDLCNKHALRLERHGHPLAGGRWRPVGSTPAERLAGFVNPVSNGCWLWNGARTAAGYGWVRVNGESVAAHRWAYETLVGPIPDGLHIDHLCHTNDLTCRGGDACPHRPCVNPSHLEPVTNAENARRGRRWSSWPT